RGGGAPRTRGAARAPLSAQAMPPAGPRAIRARGPWGGIVALADPAAELPACLLALDAVVRVAGPGGAREISVARFFRGIYTTDLREGEIVTSVAVPLTHSGWRSRFDELSRRHGDYALVGLAAHCRMDGGVIGEARLAFCGVGPVPGRAARAEAALAGRPLEPAALAGASGALESDLDPPGDVHASPALRRHLAGVLLARSLAALGRA